MPNKFSRLQQLNLETMINTINNSNIYVQVSDDNGLILVASFDLIASLAYSLVRTKLLLLSTPFNE